MDDRAAERGTAPAQLRPRARLRPLVSISGREGAAWRAGAALPGPRPIEAACARRHGGRGAAEAAQARSSDVPHGLAGVCRASEVRVTRARPGRQAALSRMPPAVRPGGRPRPLLGGRGRRRPMIGCLVLRSAAAAGRSRGRVGAVRSRGARGPTTRWASPAGCWWDWRLLGGGGRDRRFSPPPLKWTTTNAP